MRINNKSMEIITNIKLTGNLTIHETPKWKELLLADINARDEITIDASEVTKIDSSGLQLLIWAKCYTNFTEKPFYLLARSKPIADLINIFSLEKFFSDASVVSEYKNIEVAL